MENKDFIKELNRLAEEHEIYNAEDVWDTGTILDDFAKNAKVVKWTNKTDSRRWYIMHEDVYKYNDMYIGVCQVGELKSESMSVSDTMVTVEFYEMKPVESVTYVRKK